jgi:hypothetical protein
MADTYRSYVVRVRRAAAGTSGVRLEVEDLLGGRRATVTGGPAEAIGERLESIVATGATGSDVSVIGEAGPAVRELPPGP